MKASKSKKVDEGQTRLIMRDMTGIARKGKEGLGMRKMKKYSNCYKKDKRSMIVKEIREKEERKKEG